MPVRCTPLTDLDAMPSPTAAKSLAIIDLLARHPGGLTSARAARLSGITPNLVFRILKTLVAMGFAVQHAESKAYTMSQRLLDLSGPKVGDRSLVICSHEALASLRDASGETAQLMIESGGKGLVLDQVHGTHALQVCGQIGMRVPLHSCAPGKAILAWWTDERRKAWLHGHTLKRFTSNTLTTQRELDRDLLSARAAGYAIDRAEGVEGIHCVAAPILDVYGQPLAAVTVMAPAARMPEESFSGHGSRCSAAARAIEATLRQ